MNARPVPVITIDGPGGSGKGTAARLVASRLGWHLLDSGALYRLTAVAGRRARLDPAEPGQLPRLEQLARELKARFDGEQVLLEGADVTAEVRAESTGDLASQWAAIPAIRRALLDLQQGFRQPPGLVADGRDMGTVIFPDATTKVFLTASAEERARRRHNQLKEKGVSVTFDGLLREILSRDARDAQRAVAPLKPADDAVLLDTTGLSIDEVVDRVLALVPARAD